jgi:hypothetical protein
MEVRGVCYHLDGDVEPKKLTLSFLGTICIWDAFWC